jgi:hypothetical protein
MIVKENLTLFDPITLRDKGLACTRNHLWTRQGLSYFRLDPGQSQSSRVDFLKKSL